MAEALWRNSCKHMDYDLEGRKMNMEEKSKVFLNEIKKCRGGSWINS